VADISEKAPKTVRDKAIRTALPVVGVVAVGITVTAVLTSVVRALALWFGTVGAFVGVVVARPVRTAGLTPWPRPCTSFDEAIRRLEIGPRRREKSGMHPKGVTLLWDHGRRTPHTAVLLHGLSNSPYSMVRLGAELHDRGWNVIAPRLPRHGLADLATDELRHLTAEDLRDAADEAVDIAAGLGESVTVVGISGGGVVAAWMGQFRPEVQRTVLVAPAFGLSSFGPVVNGFLTRVMLLIPSVSIWKDPQLKAGFPGLGHNYKRMHSRGVGEISRLGMAALRAARTKRPATSTAALVLNASDKAIDPVMAREIADAWESLVPVDRFEFPASAGLGHEVIDPADPEGDVHVTYPALLGLIDPAR
jgi:esterase/lipase